MCEEETKKGVSQAYIVAETLAEEFAERTAGMTREEIWEVADVLLSHCVGVQELLDDGETEEHILADPAYGEPVWSARSPPSSLKVQGLETRRFSCKHPNKTNISKQRTEDNPRDQG